MRTLIDIPDRQVEALAAIASAKQISRAEVIRRAIAAYLEQHRPSHDDAFGIWKQGKVDGLSCQENLRSKW